MRDNNNITEAQLLSCPGSLNWTYLTSSDVVVSVLGFGAVAVTMEIVWLHAVTQISNQR